MKKAEGRRQSAVGRRRALALALVAHTHARRKLCSSSTHRAAAFCLLLTAFCLLSGCAVDEQRGVPPGAQATGERGTDEIAAGQGAEGYKQAPEGWRAAGGGPAPATGGGGSRPPPRRSPATPSNLSTRRASSAATRWRSSHCLSAAASGCSPATPSVPTR